MSEVAPLPGSLPQAGPPAALGTRVIGLAYALACGLLGALVLSHASAEGFAGEERLFGVVRAGLLFAFGYPAALGLVALATGHRPAARLNPLGLPLEAWWFQALFAMTWRETKRFFSHPVAYIVLSVFLLFNGLLFLALLDHYTTFGRDFQAPATSFVTNNGYLFFSLVIVVPAVTMRLLAEEQKSGTLELLLTAPVTDIQVVLSKFLGTTFSLGLVVGATFAYLAMLSNYAPDWDWGPILASYAGLFLMLATLVSIGLFCSSLSDNQIVAFVLAALVSFLLLFAGGLVAQLVDEPRLTAALRHLSMSTHQEGFASGVVRASSVVFYLSLTSFFLFLAVRGVESHRWR